MGKLLFENLFTIFTQKTVPTVDAIYETLKDISTGASYKFPYGRTTLYQKIDNPKVIMETQDSCLEVKIFAVHRKIYQRKLYNRVLR